MTDYPKDKRGHRQGIKVQCIGCNGTKFLSFDEAAELDDMPSCERCLLPMVAVEAKA